MTITILVTTFLVAQWLLNTESPMIELAETVQQQSDYPRGIHNGRLLGEDDFSVEITIFETGVPPEFRIYPYFQGQSVLPSDVNLTIDLGRTGNVVDHFYIL